MSNILYRLRCSEAKCYEYGADGGALLGDAANEIESLRAKLADAEAKLADAEPVAYRYLIEASDGETYTAFDDADVFGSHILRKEPLYTTPQPAPDVQAAVEAALEKAATIVRKQIGHRLADEILAIPRDSSALDEYKADIDAHKGALILSASKCKELEKELSRVKDRQELDDRQIVYLIECAVGERNSDIKRLLDILVCANSATNNGDGGFYYHIIAELKAKYNL